jgi:alkanesulfonate monooxygenase SsuD/methylene tetrahydromethanopterin reductase-like flavin-dependent oxidoreductase (luciferase family)
MKLALFAEIPVPKPWTKGKEQRIFQETIKQAVFAEQMGFHSFWSTEHHFLDEMSHSSNPEQVYAAIAALTTTLRLGYGVRLMPKPYNHPVRTAESVATLDCISGGRVEFGGGRSGTQVEMEGFGINPHETRAMQEEAFRHLVGCWMNEEYAFEGKYWSMPKRTVVPRVVQEPHPPLWCASGSVEGHYEIGKLGTSLLSFAVCTPPEQMVVKYQEYERGLKDCTDPVSPMINRRKGAMSMTHCDDTDAAARAVGEPSLTKYLNYSFPRYAAMTEYSKRFQKDLGTFAYTADIKKAVQEGGGTPQFDLEQIFQAGGHMIGGPERCLEVALRFDAIGTDVLFCLLNTWEIPHEKVMHSIELLGKHVIPVLNEREKSGESKRTAA